MLAKSSTDPEPVRRSGCFTVDLREMARWLAWGVLAGGLIQLLLHVPPLIQRGLLGGAGEAVL